MIKKESFCFFAIFPEGRLPFHDDLLFSARISVFNHRTEMILCLKNRYLRILLFSVPILSGINSLMAQPVAVRINQAMGRGINLGHTLEPPNEGDWNNGPAQEHYFDDFKAAGFTSVRLPIRWDKHTATAPPYTIDAAWLDRVEQIVDWALNSDLCVVLNTHYEEWFKLGYQRPENQARFDSIWSQISTRFRKKSEKLVFEIIDEPVGISAADINELNSHILSIIRKKNPERVVLYSGNKHTGPDELLAARIPADDYLIGTFHFFEPDYFALEGITRWGSEEEVAAVQKKFKKIAEWGFNNQLPINLGEFGAIKSADFNDRMHFYAVCAEACSKNSISFNVWDDGSDFAVYNRDLRQWNDIRDIILHPSSLSPTSLNIIVIQDSIIRIDWNNRCTEATELLLQRRTEAGTWETIARPSAESFTFDDSGSLPTGLFYYYRIGIRCATEEAYSYPVRVFLPHYQRNPFHGVPFELPGTLEAEDFDIGFEGYTWHDTDAKNIPGKYRAHEGPDIESRWNGYQLTHVAAGEWCEYTLRVTETGRYRIDTWIAAREAGGRIGLSLADDTLVWEIPSSGNTINQIALSAELELDSGICTLRMNILELPEFNIDRFVFSKADDLVVVPEGREGILVTSSRQGTLTIYDRDTRGGTIALYALNGRFIRLESFKQEKNEFIIPFNHAIVYRVVLSDGTIVTGKLLNR